jgi:hypothetical protein
MYTHRFPLQGGAWLCASLLMAGSAVAQTPGTTNTVETTETVGSTNESRRDLVDAAPTPDIDLAEADTARRILEDEARHRDRSARIARLREILSQRGDRERLARLDDIERRERDRHEVHQRRVRDGVSDRTARGVDDIVRRGGTFRAHARDIAVARQRVYGVDRERADRDSRRTQSSPDVTRRSPARAPTRVDTPTRSDSSRGPR